MRIRVKLYGELRGITGLGELELDLPGEALTVGAAVEALTRRFPALKPALQTVAYAVGDQIVPLSHPLEEGQELALLPPVSGG